MPSSAAARRRGYALVFVATIMWSLAGVFARLIPHLDFGTVLFGRAFFGGASGLIVAYVEWRSGRFTLNRLATPLTLLVIFLSSTAITAYVGAVLTTTIADVLVIYATLPFVAAGMAYVTIGERASRRTLIAAAIAMVGMVVMVAGGLGHGRLLGQSLSFLMTATFAGLLVVQRGRPDLPVSPINAVAALIASGFGFLVSRHVEASWFDIGVLFVFGVTSITIGFGLFIEGAKFIPSAEASLIAMLDVVLGPLWVLIAFGEQPDRTTIIGGCFVLAAAIWRLAPELLGRGRGEVTPASTPL